MSGPDADADEPAPAHAARPVAAAAARGGGRVSRSADEPAQAQPSALSASPSFQTLVTCATFPPANSIA